MFRYFIKKFVKQRESDAKNATKNPVYKEIVIDGKNSVSFADKDNYKCSDPFDIKINEHPNEPLPYEDLAILNPNSNPDLTKLNINRDQATRVVLRSDHRNMEQITEAGGFHPKCTWSEHIDTDEKTLDVTRHRLSSSTSGFVSSTVSPKAAHMFGVDYAQNHDNKYTVYALETTGAMSPGTSMDYYPEEHEYSIIGGVDLDKVISYRNCELDRSNYHSTCSNLFFNEKFIKDRPALVEKTIEVQLFKNESPRL